MHEVRVLSLNLLLIGVVVLELLLPECMNKVAFEIVGCMFDERGFVAFFANLRTAFAQGVQVLLFIGLDD